MNSCLNVVYVNPIPACDGGKEEEAASGPEVDFLLSSLHLSSFVLASVQTLPCVLLQAFASTAKTGVKG